jgi:type VI secretion system secreted protein Hcp
MAVDMFMKFEGDKFKGESRDKTHPAEIDVLAWSWGMSNSGTAHMGGGAGAGKANIQDVSLTKYVDASSAALMLACCTEENEQWPLTCT